MEDNKLTEKLGKNEIACFNCGSQLTFKPGTEHLTCSSCGTENRIEIDKTKIAEATREIDFHKFLREMETSAPKFEVVTIKCEACGAAVTFKENVVSSDCDFCGAPLVAKKGTTSSIIEPKALLPFKIGVDQGKELFRKWLKDLWWAPNKLKHYAREGRLTGIYTPYWTYDADTATSYRGERGDDYQTTETYTENGETKTRTVTKTRWTSVSGHVRRYFDDTLVPASKSLPEKHIDALEPWDLGNLVPFDPKFLSGFKAENYQIDVRQGFEVAKQKMEVIIRQDINKDIGGDHQRINSLSTQHSAITFKHILLPIWLSAYKYNEKTYRFMVNGRTGEVQGERPYSWIKITLAILLAIAIIAAIVYFSQEA